MTLYATMNTTEAIPLFWELLELSKKEEEPFVLYGFIADELGINATTVYRYATKDVDDIPLRVERYLIRLKDKIKNEGFEIVSKNEKKRVKRSELVSLYNTIMQQYSFSDEEMKKIVATNCKIEEKSLERRLREKTNNLMGRDIIDFLNDMQNVKRFEYRANKAYHIYELVYHPNFGLGYVNGKEKKDKIVVKFRHNEMRLVEKYIEGQFDARKPDDLWASPVSTIGYGM